MFERFVDDVQRRQEQDTRTPAWVQTWMRMIQSARKRQIEGFLPITIAWSVNPGEGAGLRPPAGHGEHAASRQSGSSS
jgi:hypothetical protein